MGWWGARAREGIWWRPSPGPCRYYTFWGLTACQDLGPIHHFNPMKFASLCVSAPGEIKAYWRKCCAQPVVLISCILRIGTQVTWPPNGTFLATALYGEINLLFPPSFSLWQRSYGSQGVVGSVPEVVGPAGAGQKGKRSSQRSQLRVSDGMLALLPPF